MAIGRSRMQVQGARVKWWSARVKAITPEIRKSRRAGVEARFILGHMSQCLGGYDIACVRKAQEVMLAIIVRGQE